MQPYLLPVLEFGPVILERLFARLPESRWDEQVSPDRFTPREALAHLADWEPIFLTRMRSIVVTPGSEIVGYDEGEMAITNRYHEWPVAESISKLKERRAATAAFLRTLGADDWSKHGVHSELGVRTVYDQANMLLGHDLYHIEHVSGMLP